MADDQTTETVEEPQEAPEAAQEPAEAPEDPQEPEDGKKGNSEAAKWRVRFREAEAELDALKSKVADMQAKEISQMATGPGRLHDGQDLLLTSKIGDLLDDGGHIDEVKVEEAVAELSKRKPHLARPALEPGVGVGEKGDPPAVGWADVLAG